MKRPLHAFFVMQRFMPGYQYNFKAGEKKGSFEKAALGLFRFKGDETSQLKNFNEEPGFYVRKTKSFFVLVNFFPSFQAGSHPANSIQYARQNSVL